MSLFVVEHEHPVDRCPANNPEMAAMLLQHLSAANAAGYDITVQGEAVIDNAHTLYLILDAPDQENVTRYMQPFTQVGTVEIKPASSCEAAVARGTCDAP